VPGWVQAPHKVEVSVAGVAVLRAQGRLDVAVYHTLTMGDCQRAGDLIEQAGRGLWGARAARTC
jgi:hypothetical protein